MSNNSALENLDYEIVAERIVKFPGALADFDYVDIVESLGKDNWIDNYRMSDVNGPTRKELSIVFKANTPAWINYFVKMNQISKTYCNEILNVDYPVYRVMDDSEDTVHISKYRVNGFVLPHGDEDHEEDNGVHTIIWYLNDDYEGGELGFSKEGIEIKAKKGDVFVYPSYFIHYANSVTSGFKYISIRREEFF